MISELALGLTFLLFYFICHAVAYERERKKKNYPPGAYDFPIIGSTIQFLFASGGLRGSHYEKLHKLSKRYGKITFARNMAYTCLLVEDPETVREIIASPDWANRFPDHPQFREHLLDQNLGIMFSGYENHREMRKFTARTLRKFGFGELKSSEQLIQREVDDFLKILNSERQNPKSGVKNEVSMRQKFKVPNFNVLWTVMAGERFSYEDPKINALIHAVEDCAKINVGLDPEWSFPPLRFIPGCSPSRAKRPSFVIAHNFFIDLLRERKLKGTYKEVQNDFIDYFIHKIEEEKNNPATFYTDDQFQVTCVDLLFGGLDTTASLLEFSILYMIKFPWIQRKVQAEIDAVVVGTDRSPNISDRQKLKYAEATMLESLRWANITPIMGRTSVCDTKVGPYNIKKETLCAMNTTAVNMSKEVWGDPENFRPERFLNENNEIINSQQIFSFGGGKRLCPGSIVAKVIWIAFFTTLMQRYNFSVSPAHPEPSTNPDPGIANSPKPFHCIITPRQNLN